MSNETILIILVLVLLLGGADSSAPDVGDDSLIATANLPTSPPGHSGGFFHG
jgi:hypothetical protein